jgi:hypothetical protein
VVNPALPVQGSRLVEELLTKTFEKHFGATWAFEEDPIKAAHLMIDHIDRKRRDLGLPQLMFEVPYAPQTVETPTAGAATVPGEVEEPVPAAAMAGGCRGPAIQD